MSTYKCPTCGSSAKNPKTFEKDSHINNKRHQKALAKQGGAISLPSQTSGSGSNVVLQRLSALETQNKMILERLLSLESQIRSTSSPSSATQSSKANSEVRSFLLRNLSRGKSVNVDRIADKTKSYHWSVVEKIISEMVDEEVFDIAEANSKHKVLGRFGMIIRR